MGCTLGLEMADRGSLPKVQLDMISRPSRNQDSGRGEQGGQRENLRELRWRWGRDPDDMEVTLGWRMQSKREEEGFAVSGALDTGEAWSQV